MATVDVSTALENAAVFLAAVADALHGVAVVAESPAERTTFRSAAEATEALVRQLQELPRSVEAFRPESFPRLGAGGQTRA